MVALHIYHFEVTRLRASTIIKYDDPSLPLSMLLLPLLVFICSTLPAYVRAVTVYGQIPLGFTSASDAVATVLPAYNTTRLKPPPIPDPAPDSAFTLTLQQNAAAVSGLSIPHVGGCLWGFSIEMSVISQVRKSKFSYVSSSIFSFVDLLALL